jgi:aspartate aminotransferase
MDRGGDRAMRAGQTHYTQVDGTPELKAAIVAKFKRENGLECKPENISAARGGKQMLHNALMATLDPGDEVLIPAPSWVAYADITHSAEGVPVWVPTRPENGFKLTPPSSSGDHAAHQVADAQLAVQPERRGVSGARLRALARCSSAIRRSGRSRDDMYEHVLFDGRKFATLAVAAPQLAPRTLTVNGLSKTFAMTGWRLGYACGPVELIRAMARMQGPKLPQPVVGQPGRRRRRAQRPYGHRAQPVREFQARRDFIVPRLNAVPGLSCTLPHGAFYVYVSCAGWIGKGNIKNDADVTAHLLEHGVALPNGAGYGLSPYFRVSFASSLANLKKPASASWRRGRTCTDAPRRALRRLGRFIQGKTPGEAVDPPCAPRGDRLARRAASRHGGAAGDAAAESVRRRVAFAAPQGADRGHGGAHGRGGRHLPRRHLSPRRTHDCRRPCTHGRTQTYRCRLRNLHPHRRGDGQGALQALAQHRHHRLLRRRRGRRRGFASEQGSICPCAGDRHHLRRGLQQAFRMDSMSKPLHAGRAAEAGVTAALAAREGVTGSLTSWSASPGRWARTRTGKKASPRSARTSTSRA